MRRVGLAVLLLAATSFAAVTRKIAPTGTNTGNCVVSACADLAYAYGQAAAGDDILATSGTYAGNMSITGPAAKPGATVLIHTTAGGVINVPGGWGINQSTNNIEVDDLTATGVGLQDTSNVVFRRVRAMHGTGSAGWFLANAHNFQCFQCEIGFQDPGDGLKFFVSANGINSNILFDGLFEHDLTRNNDPTQHQDGIETEAANTVTIQNSTFFNLSTQGFYVVCDLPNCGTTNFTFINNWVGPAQLGFNNMNLRGGSSIFVKYNTFVSSSQFIGPEPTNVHVVGNILAGWAGQDFSCQSFARGAVEFKYNVIELPAGLNCNPADGTNPVRQNVTSTLANPNSGSATTFDLHLLAGSPAIDAGSPTDFPATDHDGQARPNGPLPDSGADEFGVVSGPIVSFSQNTLNFAATTIGSTAPGQTTILTNTGNADLVITSNTITGANAAEFQKNNICGSTITAGNNCAITSSYSPTVKGPVTASITLVDNAPGSPQSVVLNGIGLISGADATASPGSIDFGSVVQGQPSVSQDITLTNYGSIPLNINSIVITGPNALMFSKTQTCVATLASAAFCKVTITFTPSALGPASAAVSFTDNAAGSPQNVSLVGNGAAAPSISFKNYVDTEVPGNTAATTVAAGTLNVANGDAIVSCVGASGTVTVNSVNDSCGNILTRQKRATGSPGTLEMWVKLNAAVCPASTLTATYATAATSRLITAANYIGPTAIDQSSCNSAACDTQSTGLGRTALNVTTTQGNELLAACSWDNGSTFWQGANSYALRTVALRGAVSMDYQHMDKIVSTTGVHPSGNFATVSTTGNYETVFVTLAAPSSGGGSPAVNLAPASLTFTAQNIGTSSASQPVTLTNTGTAPLNFISIVPAGDYSQTNNCGASLAPAAFCTLNVTFSPTAAGARNGSVTITDNAAGSPHVIGLSGTGVGVPAISLVPSSLTFTAQGVGSSSTPQPVVINSAGTAALAIASISFTGANAGDYSQTNNCPASLPIGNNCTVLVTFSPTAIGTRTASLSVADNASGSPQTAGLTGTGVASAVTLSTASLNFSGVVVSVLGAPQSVTLTNSGGGTLTISGITSSSDYPFTTTCGATLGAGANCTITVRFQPTASGQRGATLSIADNAAGSPHNVALSGVGLLGAVVMASNFSPDVVLSTTGSDNGPCSSDFPCASLSKGQTTLRSKAGTGARMVMLHGGTYRLTSTLQLTSLDNGSATNNPTVYAGYNGETVVITGTQPVTGFTCAGANSCGTGGNDCSVNLPTAAWKRFETLYYNGVRRPRPQHRSSGTNHGYLVNACPASNNATMCFAGATQAAADTAMSCPAGVLAAGNHCAFQSAPCSGGTPWMDFHKFMVTPGDLPVPGHGLAIGDIELLNFQKWAMSRLRLQSCATGTCTLTGPDSLSNGDSGCIPSHFYILENTKEDLAKGQWYLDRDANSDGVADPTMVLHVCADTGAGEDPTTATVEVPQLDPASPALVSASGVQNVTFQNIAFQGDNWFPADVGLGDSQGIPLVPAALSFTNSSNIALDALAISHIQGWGVEFRGSSVRNTVSNGVFTDLGAGAIRIGMRAVQTDTDTTVPSQNTVKNNLIAWPQRIQPTGEGTGAVFLGDTHDNTVTHNDCVGAYTGCYALDCCLKRGADDGSSTTQFFAYNNTFSFNTAQGQCVNGVCNGVLNDHPGLIYVADALSPNAPTTGPPSLSPVNTYANHILNNVGHDFAFNYDNNADQGVQAIYLDQGSSNNEIQNNLIYRSAHTCAFNNTPQHVGPNQFLAQWNLWQNNIFARCGSVQSNRQRVVNRGGDNPNSMVWTKNVGYFNSGLGAFAKAQGLPGHWNCFANDQATPALCTGRFSFASNDWYNLSSALIGSVTSNNTSTCTGVGTPSYCTQAFTAITTIGANTTAQTVITDPVPGNANIADMRSWMYAGASSKVLFHYQDWWGCSGHLNIGQASPTSSVLIAQTAAAMVLYGGYGLVIDWAGNRDATKACRLANTNAWAAWLTSNFATVPLRMGIMVDGGGLTAACPTGATDRTSCLTTELNAELDYVNTNYAGQAWYLKDSGSPMAFFFINEASWSGTNWTTVWAAVKLHTNGYAAPFKFVFQDTITHAQGDGAFTWMANPQTYDVAKQFFWGDSAGTTPAYYNTFYTACRANPTKICVGMVKKGFDDGVGFGGGGGGLNRVQAQRCGQTIRDTAAVIGSNGYTAVSQLAYVGVPWNDYEEGTEVETGVSNCYTITASIASNTLSWSLVPGDATYSTTTTIDHYAIYYGTSTSDLRLAADNIPVASGSLNIQALVPTGSWNLYVRMVGKPFILNQLSNSQAYAAGTGQPSDTLEFATCKTGVCQTTYNSSNFNIYGPTAGAIPTGWTNTWASDGSAAGEDAGSVTTDPLFTNPFYPVDNWTVGANLSGIGFVPFDYTQAGRQRNNGAVPVNVPDLFPVRGISSVTDY